jgi:uncharacterized membrane protein
LGNGASAAYTLWRTGTPGETDMMNGRMMDGWGMTLGPGLFCVLVLVLLVLGIVALVKHLRASVSFERDRISRSGSCDCWLYQAGNLAGGAEFKDHHVNCPAARSGRARPGR